MTYQTITVRTQADLDAALAAHSDDPQTTILINSPAGVWLKIGSSCSAVVRAYGSATVAAYDTVTVEAYDSSTVRASGSATVWAYGSATVAAYDTVTVRANGSAAAWAYDVATVRAYDTATVRAYDSTTVRAYDSATVEAYGSATVRAHGSATVRAYDTSTVQAYDSATVQASRFVAVHLHSARVTITGGVVIAVHDLDLVDPQTWVEYTGAETTDDGHVILYKAVDNDLHSHRLTQYPLGGDVSAPDWRDDNDRGGGLHASPHPHQALTYYRDAKRMLRVTVPLADLRPIPGGIAKAKARTVHVLDEVTLDGDPIGGAA